MQLNFVRSESSHD